MPDTPRVAVDLRALVPAPTGIGVYTRSLLLAMARTGAFRFTGMAHKPVHGAGELAAAGVALETRRAPLGVLWQQIVLPWRISRRGRGGSGGREPIDLLWSPLLTLPLAGSTPAVVTVHDLTTLLFPEHHRAKVRWSILPFLRPSLERARRIVTLSRSAADDIARHFPRVAAKIRVVYPGIDPEFRPGAEEEIAATRRELGAPEGYLLYAGTLEPRKEVPRLLDAWESLAAAGTPPPPLVLAGPYGWGDDRLLARLRALRGQGVLYLGRVDRARLVRLFQAARLFVYPSLYEGFGLPPAEALACGVPVVVTRSSSLPEVAGDAGIYAEPGDTGSLANALRGLLADPGREADLRSRALDQAAGFRWERAAREMEEVFRDALR
jgi:glycosyltransferase involved in cell wall biosynthesis